MTTLDPRTGGPDDRPLSLFRDLTVRIGDRVLVRDASLEVTPGEVTVLVGPSGVGKSVLADVAFRLSPSHPRDAVSFEGTLGQASDCGSIVFQRGGGLGHLTLAQNLRLVSDQEEANLEALREVKLDPARPGTPLSGGEARRLAVARALVARRKLLWLDEPAAGLDVASADDMALQLREHAGRYRIAIVVTSHQPEFIARLADRVVFLGHEGRLVDLPAAVGGAKPLAVTIRDRIRQAGRSTWSKTELRRPPLRLSRIAEVIAEGLAGIPRLFAPGQTCARASFRRSTRLAVVEGALFYPFVGAVFAGIIILALHMAVRALPTWQVLTEMGPSLVVRVSPPIAAILVGARAGSAIAAWYGQLTVGRQFEALSVLGRDSIRPLVAPGWAGLALAGLTGTASFAAALGGVILTYLLVAAPDASAATAFIENFDARSSLAAVAKTAVFAMVLSGCTLACARHPKRQIDLVASDLTRGIMLSTIAVMLAELAFLSLELCT
jgi:ABC-type nitrate/sulfonate/bicarbonate transport system ATPase subunit/ABC-type transporter Mla maintaining outer membrane lipid asymmetry permease subunit MlaE